MRTPLGASFQAVLRRFAVALLSMLFAVPALAQEIWFAPPAGLARHDEVHYRDFVALFGPDPAWPIGASGIQTIEIDTSIASAPAHAAQRKVIADWAVARHKNLAMTFAAVPPGPNECGIGVEGYSRPGRPGLIASNLAREGIGYQYAVIESPLTFGHYATQFRRTGRTACQYSIEQVATNVAEAIQQIRAANPNVKFVIIEAFNHFADRGASIQDLTDYIADLKRLGALPEAMLCDCNWVLRPRDVSAPLWQSVLPQAVAILKSAGLKWGIFLNASPTQGGTDVEWLAAAQANTRSLTSFGLHPDIVDVSTWLSYPTRLLPESNPNTLTGFLAWYLRHRG